MADKDDKQELESGREEELQPLELEGFDNILAIESMGGNAGRNRRLVNGYYKDEKFHFWTSDYPRAEIAGSPEMAFRVVNPDMSQVVKMLEKKDINLKTIPPSLIEEVISRTEDEKMTDLFKKRALQHNAFLIKSYLVEGGNPDLLPQTPYMPDIDKLRGSEK